ncbi:hypothetical protein PVL29_001644 [Vitis rotundifolia]|uniref:Uncharacterized protein n=1 Tax=Vitis rotundifolia TaxID=103349 RepID=A0AA39AFN9_VITRO|nr:hypothetical protein PVL29_001644 [Vitis rotundifolia]
MAAKPLTSEAIALTEKKMDMTLDDIIKMSKSTTVKDKKPRTPNKSQKFLSGIAQDKSAKMRRFMDSRSSLRQGVLAQRRSNFQANQFPLANEVARKAAAVPIRNRAFNRNRMPNWNRPRVGALHRNVANGGFTVKYQQQQHKQQQQHQHQQQQQQQQHQHQQVKPVPKQRPQTLDSLFADMKEQRMRVSSRQNNAGRQNGFGVQRLPRGRGRFGN